MGQAPGGGAAFQPLWYLPGPRGQLHLQPSPTLFFSHDLASMHRLVNECCMFTCVLYLEGGRLCELWVLLWRPVLGRSVL